jgi:hypothetical protein
VADETLTVLLAMEAIDRASMIVDKVGTALATLRMRMLEVTHASEEEKAAAASSTNLLKDMNPVLMGAAVGGAALAIGLGAVGVKSVEMAANYESSTNRLVTSAGESRKNIDMVRQGMLDMAGQVGTSATDLADAMYVVESAGQHGADGLVVLRAAAEGAKAENADLGVVANAVTSALQDYHLKAGDAAQVTTTLVAAVSQGKTTFQELTGAMHAVLPIASAAHISLADITAALASMTVHGISAAQASDNMAHTIGHLQKITSPQAKELAALGISARQLTADLGTKGLTGTLEEISVAIQQHMGANGQVVLKLTDALKGLPPEVQKLGAEAAAGTISMGDFAKATKGMSVEAAGQAAGFATLLKSTHGIGQDQKTGAQIMQGYAAALAAATGDATTMNVALMLTGENSKYTSDAVKAVSGAVVEGGNHVAGWSSIQSTFNQQMSEAKAAINATGIALGTGLLPPLTMILTHLTPIILSMATWTSHHQQLAAAVVVGVGAFGALVAISIIARTVLMAFSVVQGVVRVATLAWTAAQWLLNVALTANPIGIVIVAIAALIVIIILVVTHWQQLREWVIRTAETISAFIDQHRALAVVIGLIGGPITITIGLLALLITHWQQVHQWIMTVAGAIASFIAQHQALAVAIGLIGGPIYVVVGAIALLVTHWNDATAAMQRAAAAAEGVAGSIGRAAQAARNMPVIGGIAQGLGIPGFHEGGDIPAGQLSIVGERGPELFVPRGSGTIVPSGHFSVSSGGGGGGGTDMGDTNDLLNAIAGLLSDIRDQVSQPAPATTYGRTVRASI